MFMWRESNNSVANTIAGQLKHQMITLNLCQEAMHEWLLMHVPPAGFLCKYPCFPTTFAFEARQLHSKHLS